MAIDYDKQEPEEERLRKQQRHLSAKLENLEIPPWFMGRLKEETAITDEDVSDILATGTATRLLPAETLDRVWMFIRRWQAGGVTENNGELVIEERVYQGPDDTQTPPPPEPKVLYGVDLSKAHAALAGLNGAPKKADPVRTPAPVEPPSRVQEIVQRVAANPKTSPPEQRGVQNLPAEDMRQWLGLCDRWAALHHLCALRGFKSRFAQRANWASHITMKALESRAPMYDVNDKYWWLASALTWAENGGFTEGMEGFTTGMLEEIERSEKQGTTPQPTTVPEPAPVAPPQPDPPQIRTVFIEIPVEFLKDEISFWEVMLDGAFEERESADRKINAIQSMLAQLRCFVP